MAIQEGVDIVKAENIMELVEANKIMAGLIDRLFIMLLQHEAVEEIEHAGILPDIAKAARRMSGYE